MPELDLPFLGRVPITILAVPFLYGPLAVWVILRLAGLTGGEKRRKRGLRRHDERQRRSHLMFWACDDCHSLTPEPASVCYSCGAPRVPEPEPAHLPASAESSVPIARSTPRQVMSERMAEPRTSERTAVGPKMAQPRTVASRVPEPAAPEPLPPAPQPLPAVAWREPRTMGQARTGSGAVDRSASGRRPRLTVVTPERPAQEAIQGARRYLADPNVTKRHQGGEEEAGIADVLDGTTGQLSAGHER